jgi:[ribosomal protein S5]-alanine N-acetyltransferase
MLLTERLIIKPLTYQQLMKYIKCDHSLEEELGLNKNARSISPELREALVNTILPNVAGAGTDYMYSTLWTAIAKSENKMVGDICIMGKPDANAAIEIGYGTNCEFRNRGFITEAVGGIIQWAKMQTNIKYILASTEKVNVPSFRVLEKNDFIMIGENEELFNWQLKF